jgi:hypothetical protein
MTLPLAFASSQVVRKRLSGCIGSKAIPNGALVKSDAKSSSMGVCAPPTGRPVASSIRTRQTSRSTTLVQRRSPS